MFQADSDYYQYTTSTATEGDAASTWQPTAEHVIQEGELIFRPPEQKDGTEGEVIHKEDRGEEGSELDTQTEGKNQSGEGESKEEEMKLVCKTAYSSEASVLSFRKRCVRKC